MKRLKMVYIATVILAVVFGHQCGRQLTVPDDLIGKWETSAAKYESCFFELRKEEIIFGTAEGDINVCIITKVKKEKESTPEKVSYTITYADAEGLKYKFPIYYQPSDNRIIRFKNQPEIIWTKGKAIEIP